MPKYTLTLIGAGDRGNTYMSMIQEHYPDLFDLDTVCDLLPERMDDAVESYGFRTKEADWQKAILAGRPDIVLLAVPAYFHCDMAMFAMRNGCHVLSEKPMDLSLAKCFALKQCREETGKVLAVGMQYRNVPWFRAMQHAMEQKLFGENLMIHWSDFRETRPKIAMHDALYGNGGPLVDMACHLFDLMRLWYNSDPVRVYCQWRRNALHRPELTEVEAKAADACLLTVEYENGSLGEMMLNWGLPFGVNDDLMCTVMGSQAIFPAHAVPCDPPVEILIEDYEEAQVSPFPEDEEDLINPERAVLRHFLAEIEGSGTSQVSEDHGIVCLAASLAALRSGALGRPVTLDEIYELQPTVYECMTAAEN
ncbi:MAG: Gfo/Idh/MocA family oxidoreductase [Firmicutes bacterium]|nr:Gfo/Idh/MocA family oxidoreductase [Bacillota bacterium]